MHHAEPTAIPKVMGARTGGAICPAPLTALVYVRYEPLCGKSSNQSTALILIDHLLYLSRRSVVFDLHNFQFAPLVGGPGSSHTVVALEADQVTYAARARRSVCMYRIYTKPQNTPTPYLALDARGVSGRVAFESVAQPG